MMRGWLFALAVALPWLAWPAAPAPGQTLPPAVDPGIQEQRLLPPRLPRLGPIVARGLDCDSDFEGAATCPSQKLNLGADHTDLVLSGANSYSRGDREFE